MPTEHDHKQESEFRRELDALLNRYSKENVSNTPDWILGGFLRGCLLHFDCAVNDRDKWYGVALHPGAGAVSNAAASVIVRPVSNARPEGGGV